MLRALRVALLIVAVPVGTAVLITATLTLSTYAALVVATELYAATH